MGTHEEDYMENIENPHRSGGMIGPTEWYGVAKTENGVLNIGGLEVPYFEDVSETAEVYVNRMIHPNNSNRDGVVFEIHLAVHDGLALKDHDRRVEESYQHPLGDLAYWRIEGFYDDEFLLEDVGMTKEELIQFDQEIADWQAEAEAMNRMLDEG